VRPKDAQGRANQRLEGVALDRSLLSGHPTICELTRAQTAAAHRFVHRLAIG
jgi:hypothetical protein